MVEPLWTLGALVAATGGTVEGEPTGPIQGVSIDSRDVAAGDMFVALTDQRDGHEFVTQAFAQGAVLALVRHSYQRAPADGAVLRVDDPLAAMEAIGRAARGRLAADAQVVAVTGSAGKTGTKEMIRAALETVAPGRVHASVKSYNNHWGVPLTLARMPASSRFGVFEIGMNHAGEIAPLTRMVRPDVAVVTNVLPVHVGNFEDGVEGVARAKAEIFEGVVPGGTAIIPLDSDHCHVLETAARAAGARVMTFGIRSGADVGKLGRVADQGGGVVVIAAVGGRQVTFRVAMPGAHIAQNAIAVVGVLEALGVEVATALEGLAGLSAPIGRGQRTTLHVAGDAAAAGAAGMRGDAESGVFLLIDESYNANPASMAAAIQTASEVHQAGHRGRLLLVLGDMLELGDGALGYHVDLAPRIVAARGEVLAAGPHMKALIEALPQELQLGWAPTAADLTPAVFDAIRPGDVVMVKGSLGSRMGPVVAAIKKRFAPQERSV